MLSCMGGYGKLESTVPEKINHIPDHKVKKGGGGAGGGIIVCLKH